MIRIVYIVTAPRQSVRLFLRGHLEYLRKNGFEVFLIAPPGADLEDAARREGVRGIPVPIEREIAPLRDLVTLLRLYREIRRLRPDIVNAGTPKAGFLGVLAAYLARVPVRVYHLRALRLETTAGFKRRVLGWTERIAARCATRIVAISRSLADRFVELGLGPRDKIVVFGHGSSNGIDAERFARTPERAEAAKALRSRLGFAAGDFVIGFVGRIIPDKGIVHLFEAFTIVLAEVPSARLLLVGHAEAHHPFPPGFLERLRSHSRVTWVDYQEDPAPYYHVMDLFAFPSLREGFGNVALEAAAAGLAVVGFRSTGVVDAVEDGVTGTLSDSRDAGFLADSILIYWYSPTRRVAHGENGVKRARSMFTTQSLWLAFAGEYESLLARRSGSTPQVQRGHV